MAIAGVLAMQLQVLVLDELSAQLDPRSRQQLIQLLDSLPITQLIATPDLDMALALCSATLVLSQGRVVFSGPTEQVLSNPAFLRPAHARVAFVRRPSYPLEPAPALATHR